MLKYLGHLQKRRPLSLDTIACVVVTFCLSHTASNVIAVYTSHFTP